MTNRPDVAGTITPAAGGCQIAIAVTPRSATNRMELDANGTLRARIAAPPVDGAANDALLKLLARALKLPRSRFAVVAGAASRQKRVAVLETSSDELADRLRRALCDVRQR